MSKFTCRNSSRPWSVWLSLPQLLYACGFQLRGAIEVSDDIAPVYILQQNSVFELAREIKSLLISNNIETVDKASSQNTADPVKRMQSTRLLSVDGSGHAREYSLSYTANFKVKMDTVK